MYAFFPLRLLFFFCVCEREINSHEVIYSSGESCFTFGFACSTEEQDESNREKLSFSWVHEAISKVVHMKDNALSSLRNKCPLVSFFLLNHLSVPNNSQMYYFGSCCFVQWAINKQEEDRELELIKKAPFQALFKVIY